MKIEQRKGVEVQEKLQKSAKSVDELFEAAGETLEAIEVGKYDRGLADVPSFSTLHAQIPTSPHSYRGNG